MDTAILPFLFIGVNFGSPELGKPENLSAKVKSVDAYIFIGHALCISLIILLMERKLGLHFYSFISLMIALHLEVSHTL